MQLVCERCRKEYTYISKNGTDTHFCRTCTVYNHRRNKKIRAIQYKGGSCQKCGYAKCIEALDFHHIDPTQKLFEISRNGIDNRKWELVLKELDKCVLVCSNCHREIGAGILTV